MPVGDLQDYVYVTDSLLVITEEYLQTVSSDRFKEINKGKEYLIWNVSGRSWPSRKTWLFNGQVVNVPWTCVCKYTLMPLLQQIFAVCNSIKSWNDLNQDHLTILR